MDRADVRRGLSDEKVTTLISLISAVEVADGSQTPDNLRDRFRCSHTGGQVEYGLRGQTGHGSAADVLQVFEEIATGEPNLLTCVYGKCGPALIVFYHS